MDVEKELKEAKQATMAFKETAYMRRNLLLKIWDVTQADLPDSDKVDRVRDILDIGAIKGKTP